MPRWDRFRPRAAWVLPLLCLCLWIWAPDLGLRTEGDGYYHYLYLVTVFEDGDLDFVNQYKQYGHPYFNPQGPVWGNPFPPGSAILWAPTYALARAYTWYKGGPADPFAPKFQARAISGTLMAGILTAYLAFLLLRRRYDLPWALLAVAGAAFATPFLFYAIRAPSYAHVPTAFFLTLCLYFWLERPQSYWLIGSAAGLAALARHHMGLFIPLACLYLLFVQKEWKGALKLGGAAFLTLLPLFFYWHTAFGSWLTIPQGSGFLTTNLAGIAHSLWSARHGALVWSPILYPAVAGLVLLAFLRDGRLRVALAFFVLMVAINGLPVDWWAGDAFGGRRLVELFPFFALGLAHAFDRGAAWIAARPKQAGVAGVALVVFVSVLLTGGMHDAFNRVWLDPGAYPDATAVYGPGLRALYHSFGNPLSYPASLPFALRYGVHPIAYDQVVGAALNVDRHSDGPVLDPADPAVRKYFFRGFRFEPRPTISGTEARIFLPQLRSRTLSVVLLMERAGGAVPLEIRLNGDRVGGANRYSWSEPVGLTIDERRVKIGTNVLSLHFSQAGQVEFGLVWQHPCYPYFINILPYGVLDSARYDRASGRVEVAGWALGRKSAPEVSLVRYPERDAIPAAERYPRGDVARAHPEGAGLDRAGFTFRFPAPPPEGGRICVVFRIVEPGGRTNWYLKDLPVEAADGR